MALHDASFGEIPGDEIRVVAQEREPGAKAPFFLALDSEA
jgi:hypothetical protein